MPVVAQGDVGDQRGRDEEGGGGSGVEQAGGQRPLLAGEPLGGRLDGGGEVARFAEAQHEAGDAEAADREDQRMSHRGKRPNPNG